MPPDFTIDDVKEPSATRAPRKVADEFLFWKRESWRRYEGFGFAAHG
jgi:hypothetical protein